jgi:chaperone modulatory protein CbpM
MSPARTWPNEVEAGVDAGTLSRSLGCELALIISLVDEGVVEPEGDTVDSWRFAGMALQRVCRALRLARDLEINPPGVALVMLLLDEISQLESQRAR